MLHCQVLEFDTEQQPALKSWCNKKGREFSHFTWYRNVKTAVLKNVNKISKM